MRTEELILRLAEDGRPAPPVRQDVLWALAPALLATLALMLAGWGIRPGLDAALADPFVAAKIALPTLAAGVALTGGLALSRPEGRAGAAMAGLAVIAAAWLGLLVVNLVTAPSAAWGEALRGRTLLACLLSIPTLAVIPTATLLLALRRGASLRPRLSGGLAGLAGGAAAAAIYALHCPEDAPLFFVTWYGTGMLVAGAAGAVLGARWLRW